MIKKENKIFIIVSVSLFFILFFYILGGLLFKRQIDAFTKRQKAQSTIEIDWEKRYPYDTAIENVYSGEQKQADFYGKIKIITEIFSDIGHIGSRRMYKYADIAKLGYIISSKLTDPSVGRSYIKLKNGYWTTYNSYNEVLLDSAKEAVAPYASLQKYVNGEGIDFLYFYAPSRECKVDDELPDGIVSYTNEMIDTYLEAMESFGIHYVDLRNTLHSEGLDHYSMFYATDHHWTVETGLWAASKVTQELNSRFGISMMDPQEIGAYKPVTYENAEFGSAGQGVTHYVADSEDFTILFPEYETNYRLEIPSKGIDVTGAFQDIFIDYDELNEIMEQGGGYAYDTILYGNLPYEKITNFNNPDGPKVLMIRDSFSIVVAPYLSAACSELVLLDTRSGNGNFTGSIVSCINEFQPDVVLAFQNSPQKIK